MAKKTSISVHRSCPKENYTIMSNYILREKGVTPNIVGILFYMMSLPPEWDFSLRNMAKALNIGVAATKSGVDKLKELGYVVYNGNVKDEKGRICKADYDVYDLPPRLRGEVKSDSNVDTAMPENPCIENRHKDSPCVENPCTDGPCADNPCMDNPHTENQTQVNNNIINNNTQKARACVSVCADTENVDNPKKTDAPKGRYFPEHPKVDEVFANWVLKQRLNNNRLTRDDIERNKKKLVDAALVEDGTFDEELAVATVILAADRGWKSIWPMNRDDKASFMNRRKQGKSRSPGDGAEWVSSEEELEKSLLAN